jgi:predicted nuclease with TOPRIM domain
MSSEDIVTQLREEGCITHIGGLPRESKILHAAADEIERLRTERDEAEPLLDELWELRTEATEMREQIKRLRKERDEARMMYCTEISCQSKYEHCTPKWVAEERNWDCFEGVQ